MKGLIIILSIFICSDHLIAQNKNESKPTKLETEQWIKEKITSYSYDGGTTKHNYTIYFEGSEIIIKNELWMDITGFMHTNSRINVTDIDIISITQKTNNVWLSLRLKSGKSGFTVCEELDNRKDLFESYDFILSKSFINDNLPERMKKAFSRLIEFNGGKPLILKESY